MSRWVRLVLLVGCVLCVIGIAGAVAEPPVEEGEEGLSAKRRLVVTDFDDTYIDEWEACPGDDHSADTKLRLRKNVQVVLLRPQDLNDLRGADIKSAELELFVTGDDTKALSTEVYKVCRHWVPGEADWCGPRRGEAWGLPGASLPGNCGVPGAEADFDLVRLDSSEVEGQTAVTYSVLAAVQDWAADPWSNHGLLIRVDPLSGGGSTGQYFASSEHVDPDLRPRLVVIYEPCIASELEEISVAADPPAIQACTDDAAALTIMLTDNAGCPVTGTHTVNVTTTLGWIDEQSEPSAELIAYDGMATATLLSGDRFGVGIISATCPDLPNVLVTTTCQIEQGPAERLGVAAPSHALADEPLKITIAAVDCGGKVVPAFACDPVTLEVRPHGAIVPNVIPLSNGEWRGDVTLSDVDPWDEVEIIAQGCGLEGVSHRIRIVPPGMKLRIVAGEPALPISDVVACRPTTVTVEAIKPDGGVGTRLTTPFTFEGNCAWVDAVPEELMLVEGRWEGVVSASPPQGMPGWFQAKVNGDGPDIQSQQVDVLRMPDPLGLLLRPSWTALAPSPSERPTHWTITSYVAVEDTCATPLDGVTVVFTTSEGVMVPDAQVTDAQGRAHSIASPDIEVPPEIWSSNTWVWLGAEAGPLTAEEWLHLYVPWCYIPDVQDDRCHEDVLRDGGFERHYELEPRWRWWSTDPLTLTQSIPGCPYQTEDWVAKLGVSANVTHVLTQNLGTMGRLHGCFSALLIEFDWFLWSPVSGQQTAEAILYVHSESGHSFLEESLLWPQVLTEGQTRHVSREVYIQTIPDTVSPGERVLFRIEFRTEDECYDNGCSKAFFDNFAVRGVPR